MNTKTELENLVQPETYFYYGKINIQQYLKNIYFLILAPFFSI